MGSNKQRPVRHVKKMEAIMDGTQKAFDKFSSLRLELDSLDERSDEILDTMCSRHPDVIYIRKKNYLNVYIYKKYPCAPMIGFTYNITIVGTFMH